jgi:hypothetical protein
MEAQETEVYRVAWSCSSVFLSTTFVGSKGEARHTQEVGAAARLEPSQSKSKNTKYVSCWNKKQTLTGSHLVRSPILTSDCREHDFLPGLLVNEEMAQRSDPALFKPVTGRGLLRLNN